MASVKITEQLAEEITSEDNEDFELVEDSGWEQEGKHQYCTMIFKQVSTGLFWSFDLSRAGSYHTDWYYVYPDEMVQVEQKEKVVVVKEWVAV